MEAETRGETAERAVAPLGIADGVLEVLDEIEDDRRDAGAVVREDVVVAMRVLIGTMKVYAISDDWSCQRVYNTTARKTKAKAHGRRL